MRKLLSLVLVCVLISPCAALLSKNDIGTTAGQFLKLGMGGKAAAMGDAVVAGVSDSTSIIWNPAGDILQHSSLPGGVVKIDLIQDDTCLNGPGKSRRHGRYCSCQR